MYLILAGIVALLVLFVWGTYNRLVVLRNRVQEAWSGIDIQLKRRTDLIPNLVSTVKGYAKHEKEVFENVTKARASMMKAEGVEATGKADTMLSSALKSLFAVAENYPQLKANENFVQLQAELSDTEDKIAYARQFYNSNVQAMNTTVEQFPGNVLANWFGFKKSEYFETDAGDKKPVNVSFA
ncbi:MAG: LemA family protein [Candidatus Roizmanbacteria bacterium]|nr:LemA family protein [Candidatus Roizmanbacteria bacterium]